MGSTSSNSSNSLELSLGLKPSYVPKTIANLFSDLAKVDDVQKKLSVLDDYLNKYKEELARVEPFRCELPQCMLFLMDGDDHFSFFFFFFIFFLFFFSFFYENYIDGDST